MVGWRLASCSILLALSCSALSFSSSYFSSSSFFLFFSPSPLLLFFSSSLLLFFSSSLLPFSPSFLLPFSSSSFLFFLSSPLLFFPLLFTSPPSTPSPLQPALSQKDYRSKLVIDRPKRCIARLQRMYKNSCKHERIESKPRYLLIQRVHIQENALPHHDCRMTAEELQLACTSSTCYYKNVSCKLQIETPTSRAYHGVQPKYTFHQINTRSAFFFFHMPSSLFPPSITSPIHFPSPPIPLRSSPPSQTSTQSPLRSPAPRNRSLDHPPQGVHTPANPSIVHHQA